MTRAHQCIREGCAVLVVAALAALISSCATLEQVHNLDDRVRLLECKELNRTLREVLGEPTPYPAARDEVRGYDERTIEHDEIRQQRDERLIEHDERTREHDERTGEHDERTGEHDERTGEHDERTIEHDERTIEHDEVFRRLVACRKDTLELQKRFHVCERDFATCMRSENCEEKCTTSYEGCVREFLSGGDEEAAK